MDILYYEIFQLHSRINGECDKQQVIYLKENKVKMSRTKLKNRTELAMVIHAKYFTGKCCLLYFIYYILICQIIIWFSFYTKHFFLSSSSNFNAETKNHFEERKKIKLNNLTSCILKLFYIYISEKWMNDEAFGGKFLHFDKKKKKKCVFIVWKTARSLLCREKGSNTGCHFCFVSRSYNFQN